MRLGQLVFGLSGIAAIAAGIYAVIKALDDANAKFHGYHYWPVASVALALGTLWCLTAIAAYAADRVSSMRQHQRVTHGPAQRPGTAQQRTVQCPSCGSPLSIHDRFCPTCGYTLQSSWPAQAPTR